MIRSGYLVDTRAMNVLKHMTHSSIDVICLRGAFGVDGANTSIRVGCGTPSLAGSNSCSSINSLRQTFSASFFGIGGECGPIEIAWLASLVGDVVNTDRGTCNDTLLGVDVTPEVVVTTVDATLDR